MLDVTDLASRIVRRPGVPGVALGVLDRGSRSTAAAGVADAETAEPLEAGAVFRIASLTKPIVATLVLTLVAEGRLELDLPAVAYLPRLRASWTVDPGITVRHLLSHQSGVHPDLDGMEAYGDSEGALEAAVREIVGRRPQRTRPGRAWWYANSGYWVLGAIAAAVLETTFEQGLEDRVLRPLGMRSTSFGPPGAGTQPALGHGLSGKPRRGEAYPRARRPSGGLHATVDDILRFATASLEASLLPPALAEQMARPIVPTVWGTRYGLGWEIAAPGGVAILGHDGDWGGYQARLLVVPARRFAFVALANGPQARNALDDVEPTVLREGCGLRGRVRRSRRTVAAVALARYGVARASTKLER